MSVDAMPCLLHSRLNSWHANVNLQLTANANAGNISCRLQDDSAIFYIHSTQPYHWIFNSAAQIDSAYEFKKWSKSSARVSVLCLGVDNSGRNLRHVRILYYA